MDVGAISLEDRVFRNADEDIQAARARLAALAPACEPQIHTRVDTSWDNHLDQVKRERGALKSRTAGRLADLLMPAECGAVSRVGEGWAVDSIRAPRVSVFRPRASAI